MKIIPTFFFILLVFLLGIYVYVQIKVNRDMNVPQIGKVAETQIGNKILLSPVCEDDLNEEKINNINTAIVYIHGGSFFTGRAIASTSLMSRWCGATECKTYLVKYPVHNDYVSTLGWFVSELIDIPENNIILVGSSAGSFWCLYIMLYIYSKKFKIQLNTQYKPNLDKNILGFISLCGILDIESEHRVGKWLFPTRKFIEKIIGRALNPYSYKKELDHVPFLLVDSRNRILNFSNQIANLQNERQFRQANTTLVYIYTDLPHNFIYDWSFPEAQEMSNIVVNFIKDCTQNSRQNVNINAVNIKNDTNKTTIQDITNFYCLNFPDLCTKYEIDCTQQQQDQIH